MMSSLQQWQARARPGERVLAGHHVTIKPFHPAHIDALYGAIAGPEHDAIWRYLPTGPFHDRAAFGAAMNELNASDAAASMVICMAKGDAVLGMGSYLRIRPAHGSCEIGMVAHGLAMQRTPASTEAHYLLARHVFADLGYRRYEWKCNSNNAASIAAARRLGFTYEGTFRQDMVVKGENRDTAWWSMLDSEWPAIDAHFQAWLDPSNFDADRRQRTPLNPIED